MIRRSYSELVQFDNYDDRFRYLSLRGHVGHTTFGHERSLNQRFYRSTQWRRIRRIVLLRDENCDLGIPGYDIASGLHIHHMNPVTVDDLMDGNPEVFDPEYLISTAQLTHNAIHYGNERLSPGSFTERRPGDTWI